MTFKEKKLQLNKEVQKVLDYNLERIWHLSNSYIYLNGALRGDLLEFLRDIINFWRKKCAMVKRNKPVFFLGTHTATYNIRKTTTTEVTNRWLNYLCAIGLLTKTKSQVNYTKGKGKLVKPQYTRNGKRKRKPRYMKDRIRGLNTFLVEPYTRELFKEANERVKQLNSKHITKGNMSYNMLALNGFRDLAEKVYLERRDLSEAKKLHECELLMKCVEDRLEQKGYTTKEELYRDMFQNFNKSRYETKRLFVYFQNELWLNLEYSRPSQAEKIKLGLTTDNWIIRPR